MAEWNRPGPAASVAAGSSRRPCPYCGTWNAPEFSFCAKCGRPLPSLGAPPGPTPSFLPPTPTASAGFATPPAPPYVGPPPFPGVSSAASAPPAIGPSPVTDRSLTDAERSLLQTRARSGPAGVVRFFGAFLGMVPLILVGTALLGTPYDPDTYLMLVLVAGVVGLVLASVSRNLRGPALRAARSGVAHEVYGVPTVQAADGGASLVTVSELTFRMKAPNAARVLPGRMNRLTFADGGPVPGARRAGVAVFLLEANGAASPHAEPCFLVSAPGLEAAATAAPRTGLARKGAR